MMNKVFTVLKKQKGFTLIELIIAGAIGVLVIGALVGVIWQLFSASSASSGNMKAIHQVQNVGLWVSKDIQQTDKITSAEDDPNTDDEELLVVEWTKYNGESVDGVFVIEKQQYRVLYRISDEKLYRDYYMTEWMGIEIEPTDFTLNSTNYIAEYITEFGLQFIGNNDLKLTISAEIPGFRPQSATRIFEIESRPTTFYWVQ
ncbi:MAG TPA: hypothetical protein DCR71_03960 [Dehalococcoidia bacterium]|nr:hypothetical protein [Dehalococcoidia bacterium]